MLLWVSNLPLTWQWQGNDTKNCYHFSRLELGAVQKWRHLWLCLLNVSLTPPLHLSSSFGSTLPSPKKMTSFLDSPSISVAISINKLYFRHKIQHRQLQRKGIHTTQGWCDDRTTVAYSIFIAANGPTIERMKALFNAQMTSRANRLHRSVTPLTTRCDVFSSLIKEEEFRTTYIIWRHHPSLCKLFPRPL